MGDTESVFDVLASEMASTTLRSAAKDGGYALLEPAWSTRPGA